MARTSGRGTQPGGSRRRSAISRTSNGAERRGGSRASPSAGRRSPAEVGEAVPTIPGIVRIDEIIARRSEPVFSFEFFPPKTEEGEQNLQTALRELRPLEPSYVSVTYGAGGSTRDRTIEIVKSLKDEHGLEAMAHLSCVGTTKEELRQILDEVRDAGIDNVLALRGDPPRGESEWRPHPGGLHYST